MNGTGMLTALVLSSLLAAASPPLPPPEGPVPAGDATRAPDVVFACEHGSVKSLIAAEWFNRRARERGLDLRAVSRGVTPDAAVPAPVAKNLAADGFDVAAFVPAKLEASSAAGARRVVTLGLGEVDTFGVPRLRWDDVPPATQDYAATREVLRRRIESLLDELGR